MGGGVYSQDVAQDFRSNQTDAFAYQSNQPAAAARRTVHTALNPFGKTREP